MYLVLACNMGDRRRYELDCVEAAAMARLLRSLGWQVDTFRALVEAA